ncbi:MULTISPECIES: hypothetical protein [Mycobacteroides]|uniref:hypothetical protein n=1 Tax=Mycobacteroides TaxID=670516 RepID=UPI00092AFB8D|nr:MULTISPECIES: hypothetical protein [Mycobacteroides]UJW66748.1 hypothetical protein H0I67_05125 [Mycobacteroides chelonae]SHW96940.1 Uncharacterised protein [Mycobacteroides abscessus subsp. abscessus]SHZ45211.1 Uncharacterised protein [Mycobacteroides abscessus subsp. abscessus]SIB79828.1 Uncharacterised protein [Mycobacteroides abscessus subsp. abscessus]SIE55650.1 Uncharacterised protein [Mycobacteroides abscessus subsp. abscessus]
MGTVATTGDPVIQMHKGVAASARAAAGGLPEVSAVGMRAGHAEILESALGETRTALAELARVGDVGASGATALADQDVENAGRFGDGWDGPEIQRKGEPHGETRVI